MGKVVKELADLINNSKIVVGYDLGNLTSQISYSYLKDEEPETITTVAGMEQFNIPTVLCKRKEVNQWFYGKEAEKTAAEKNGMPVKNLVTMVQKEEKVEIEGVTYLADELLVLFVKRSFAILSMVWPSHKVEALVITVDNLNHKMVAVLNKMVAELPINAKEVFFQSKEESFFAYTIHQDAKMWAHQVVVCDVTEGYLKLQRLEMNRKTIPVVAFIEKEEFEEMDVSKMPATEMAQENFKHMYDESMCRIMKEFFGDRLISTIYLIGDAFAGEWCKETIKFMCQGRRVFQGNNMYSKGACYSAKEKIAVSEIGKQHIFLGNDKLKANVGMRLIRNGQEVYFALLDAGQNWFESQKEVDLILESENKIEITVTPLNGRNSKTAEIILEGLPKRPPKACRIKMIIDMTTEKKIRFRLSDMGFGELYPSTGMEWIEEFEVI